jgi:hypothetical protein
MLWLFSVSDCLRLLSPLTSLLIDCSQVKNDYRIYSKNIIYSLVIVLDALQRHTIDSYHHYSAQSWNRPGRTEQDRFRKSTDPVKTGNSPVESCEKSPLLRIHPIPRCWTLRNQFHPIPGIQFQRIRTELHPIPELDGTPTDSAFKQFRNSRTEFDD